MSYGRSEDGEAVRAHDAVRWRATHPLWGRFVDVALGVGIAVATALLTPRLTPVFDEFLERMRIAGIIPSAAPIASIATVLVGVVGITHLLQRLRTPPPLAMATACLTPLAVLGTLLVTLRAGMLTPPTVLAAIHVTCSWSIAGVVVASSRVSR